ncbi:hypothetical protein LCGC14_2255320 [marine sediment metagenome]|uniref:Uncharacterized protein n=1 Tax=marine sediment metagenome TaxID=412755 RepID=A0A0F9DNT0_9ZZZZ
MSKDPFDTSNIKNIIPKNELKEVEKVFSLLNKNQTGKSLELSVELFETLNKTAQSFQAGAGSAISSVFDKMITSSGLMGPFNTLLTLIGASTAAASADALSSLYAIITSDATVAAIDTATEAFGNMLDALALGLEAASGFTVDIAGAEFSPFNEMINGFAAFLGGGIFGAAAAFIDRLGVLAAAMAATPTEPVGRGRIGGGGIPGVGNVPGAPSKLRTQFGIGGGGNEFDFNLGVDPAMGVSGGSFRPPGGFGTVGGGFRESTSVDTLTGPFLGNQLINRMDKLIQLQERAWGK